MVVYSVCQEMLLDLTLAGAHVIRYGVGECKKE